LSHSPRRPERPLFARSGWLESASFPIAAVDVAVGGIPRVGDDAGDTKCAADRQMGITNRRQFAGTEISDPSQARR
jgi:hypothetical protein